MIIYVLGIWLPDPNQIEFESKNVSWMIISGLPIIFGAIQAFSILICFRFDPPSVYLNIKNINVGRKRAELALSKIYRNTNAALHELLNNFQIEQDYAKTTISLLKKKVSPLFIGVSMHITSLYHISTDDWNHMASMLYHSNIILKFGAR